MNELKHLLSPITIKKTEIPNRVVMPPMGTGLCNPDGTVNDALLAYMNRQASSGAGADVIHASIGTHGSPGGITSAPPEYDTGFNVGRAKKLKENEIRHVIVGDALQVRRIMEATEEGARAAWEL